MSCISYFVLIILRHVWLIHTPPLVPVSHPSVFVCSVGLILQQQAWSQQHGEWILAGWRSQTRAAWLWSSALAASQLLLNHSLRSLRGPSPFTASWHQRGPSEGSGAGCDESSSASLPGRMLVPGRCVIWSWGRMGRTPATCSPGWDGEGGGGQWGTAKAMSSLYGREPRMDLPKLGDLALPVFLQSPCHQGANMACVCVCMCIFECESGRVRLQCE